MMLNWASIASARSEPELVASARRGDDRAFEELYSRYRDRIEAFILAKVHDHGRAEDIAQEVFMSALRRLRATDQPIAFKPWIYEIAKNACIDEFRRLKRTREVSLDADSELAGGQRGLLAPTPGPAAAAESRQRLDDLRGAFGGLSESQHQLLVMREFEGLSYEAIGQRTGMTRQMVESTLFRARRRLTEEYEELASGRRCEQVQAMIGEGRLTARSFGIRERRRFSRHLAHCQPCRRCALMAGVEESLVAPRSVASRVAGLLPLPILRRLWGLLHFGRRSAGAGGAHSAAAGGGSVAGGASAAGAAAPAASSLALGPAAAAIAAVALVGGGGAIGILGLGGSSSRPAASARQAADHYRSGGAAGVGLVTSSSQTATSAVSTTSYATTHHHAARLVSATERLPARGRHSTGTRREERSPAASGSRPGSGSGTSSNSSGSGGGKSSAGGSGSGSSSRPSRTHHLPLSSPSLPTGSVLNTGSNPLSGVSSTVGSVGSSAGSSVGSIGSTVGSAAGSIGSTVGSAAGSVGSTVGGVVGGSGGSTGSGSVGSTVGGGVGAAGSAVGGAANGAGSAVGGASNGAGKVIGGATSAAGGVVSGVGGLLSGG